MERIDTTRWGREDFINFYSGQWQVPVRPIGANKHPIERAWNQYKSRMPTLEELEACKKAWGITIILQNKLLCVDFDTPQGYELLKDKMPAGSCIAKTPHGYHVLIRSSGAFPETIKGNNPQWLKCLERLDPKLSKVDLLGNNSLLHSPDSPGYTWLELYREPAAVPYEEFMREVFDYTVPLRRLTDFVKLGVTNKARWVNEFCPFCEYDGKSHATPSCQIDIEGGGFKCHGSCGQTGKLTELVAKAQEVGMPLKHETEIMAAYQKFTATGEKPVQSGFAVPNEKPKVVPIKRIAWNEIEDLAGELPLIEGILPGGENAKCLIIGAAKEGKTTLMVVIIVCASQGTKVLGAFKPRRALRTAYGNFEQKGVDIRRQIERMAPAYGIPPGDMLTLLDLKGRKLSDPADCEVILAELVRQPAIELVVFDSVYMAVKDINDKDEVPRVLAFLTRLVDEVGCAVIIGHHAAVPVAGFGEQVIESALGRLGKALDRWCGSRLIYNDIPGCPADYYGELKGQIRGGIGLIDYAVAYTEITGAVHFMPWEDVPTLGWRGKERVTRAKPRIRAFQQLVIFARTKGYKATHVAKALNVSDETVSNWIKGKSEPNDDNWEQIKQFRERLIRGSKGARKSVESG